MKNILLLILITYFNFGYSQTVRTSKFAGIYDYGTNGEKEAVGKMIIYPESDTTILFYFEACKGPTSFSLGSIYERVKILSDTATFYSKSFPSCKCVFKFKRNSITLTPDFDNINCGLGHGVYLSGKFKRVSDKVVDNFKNLENQEYFFNKTSPEDYNKK